MVGDDVVTAAPGTSANVASSPPVGPWWCVRRPRPRAGLRVDDARRVTAKALPAAAVAFVFSTHRTVTPTGLEQPLSTCPPCATEPLKVLKVVPGGSVSVISLPASPDRPPLLERPTPTR